MERPGFGSNPTISGFGTRCTTLGGEASFLAIKFYLGVDPLGICVQRCARSCVCGLGAAAGEERLEHGAGGAENGVFGKGLA